MPQMTASDGGSIVYDDVGQGRPILCVHGWATHAGFFAPQISGLSDRFRVIAIDLRGHGRAPTGPAPVTVERLAMDVAELMAELDLRDTVCVGWSMGALVLWRALLAGSADRASGMVVVDMAPRVVNGGGWALGLLGSSTARTTGAAADAMRRDWPLVSHRAAQRIFAKGLEGERRPLIDWAAQELAAVDPSVMADLWLSLAGMDLRAELPSLDLPHLIVHGAQSRLYPAATAVALCRLLPNAMALCFPQSGHAPQLEEPSRFNAAITDFADGPAAPAVERSRAVGSDGQTPHTRTP